jgi:hypothetical protein
MSKWPRDRPGLRPWAFWRFEFGEEPDYEDQVIRLAERGLLFEEEIAALAERRTWRHIDTGAEHVDERAVALYERVIESAPSVAASQRSGSQQEALRARLS